MPDETTTNQEISENTPISPNSEVNMGSEPSNMPPEAPETPINADIPVSLNNDNYQNESIFTPNPEEAKPEELPAEGGKIEEIPEPAQAPETRTAQIPVSEPLPVESEPIKTEPVSVPQPQPTPAPVFVEPQQGKISLARSLLIKARNTLQFRKRKKLDKTMTLFLKKSKITNKDVGDLLHVSDATATRYLDILEKENRIKQVGKTGHAVSYSRI